jgi:hypothetical protein
VPPRYLIITIDTEVDKQRDWSISPAASFTSVTEAIPTRLTPLFDAYGFKPTYLLSPEVIENRRCAAALASLGDKAELGTHLHSELIAPERTLQAASMGGARADMIQAQLGRELEAAKLSALSDLFWKAFGYAPRSFRSGRFGMSTDTLELLAGLGYAVDSSVTPGIRWRYPEGTIDYRRATPRPEWHATPAGEILEVPLSIWPRSRIAGWAHRTPAHLERPVRGALRRWAAYDWLRPSWANGDRLVSCVERHPDIYLVIMFHSMELVPGATPYAQDEAAVDAILAALEVLLDHCRRSGIKSCGLSEVANHL